jgi:hypothetical protein
VAANVTSSVSANHREPLCYTPFSQVAPLYYPPSLRSLLRPPGGAKAGEPARVTIGPGSLPWGVNSTLMAGTLVGLGSGGCRMLRGHSRRTARR